MLSLSGVMDNASPGGNVAEPLMTFDALERMGAQADLATFLARFGDLTPTGDTVSAATPADSSPSDSNDEYDLPITSASAAESGELPAELSGNPTTSDDFLNPEALPPGVNEHSQSEASNMSEDGWDDLRSDDEASGEDGEIELEELGPDQANPPAGGNNGGHGNGGGAGFHLDGGNAVNLAANAFRAPTCACVTEALVAMVIVLTAVGAISGIVMGILTLVEPETFGGGNSAPASTVPPVQPPVTIEPARIGDESAVLPVTADTPMPRIISLPLHGDGGPAGMPGVDHIPAIQEIVRQWIGRVGPEHSASVQAVDFVHTAEAVGLSVMVQQSDYLGTDGFHSAVTAGTAALPESALLRHGEALAGQAPDLVLIGISPVERA